MDHTKPQTIIFIGKSGSGKGTQIKNLKEDLKENFLHIETGQNIRALSERDTYTGKQIFALNEQGLLQPEFIAIYIWANQLINFVEENTNIIFDGSPRRLDEAKILEKALKFYNREHIDVVCINLSDELAIERLKERGRHDDKEIADIKQRLGWFNQDVLPIIDYMKENEFFKVHEIDGTPFVGDVYIAIKRALELK